MTRTEFNKLENICETIKAERDRINKLREERLAQSNSYFDSIDNPLKNQYNAIMSILEDAKVEA